MVSLYKEIQIRLSISKLISSKNEIFVYKMRKTVRSINVWS